MKLFEKSDSGVLRLPLVGNWAIGFWPHWKCDYWARFRRYSTGWELSILWFYFGKKDRRCWSYWSDSDAQSQS